jgi:photosystem II stability/assembly factor-like uncharacterized protein
VAWWTGVLAAIAVLAENASEAATNPVAISDFMEHSSSLNKAEKIPEHMRG